MDKANRREVIKTLEVEGVKYRIRKMTARDGTYYAMLLASMALPIGLSLGLKQFGIEAPPTASQPMDRKTFDQLQFDCLRLCEVQMPAGWTPIVNDNGTFAVPDLEYDALAISALTIHALVWTFGSFFDADRFKAWAGQALGSLSMLPFFKTSTDGSSPPSQPGTGVSTSYGMERTPSTIS